MPRSRARTTRPSDSVRLGGYVKSFDYARASGTTGTTAKIKWLRTCSRNLSVSGTTGTTEFEVIRANENFDERAALVEYGADVPRASSGRLGRKASQLGWSGAIVHDRPPRAADLGSIPTGMSRSGP